MILKGTVTEVKKVDVEVSTDEIFKAAHHLSNDQILSIMKAKLINAMKENDPTLVEVSARLNWNCTEWEVYDFYDSHKNEDYYTRHRLISDHERFMIETFNDFAATIKTHK